ncbi:glucose 1-dehydrogenase [Neisseria animaloris]|uniref:glucose 1-dehydrogenase n=1 Tax=Neisseria animaloris TaxID=326522 RepID=UPI000D316E15|nr:glucose 1-dehydrogenase [Neisseria animaloris]
MSRLAQKTALVTGAARGIGEAIARSFAAEGAFVYLSDIRHEEGERVAESIGSNARYLPLDVREENDWEKAVQTILTEQGKLDILVNNAGITGLEQGAAHNPEHASLDDWHAVHHTNLDGTFLGCRCAIRAMRPQGHGSIINISSRSGLVGIPPAAAYASSKAAIRNHSKSVALYCAQQGLKIRCNSIHPAAIFTPMWEPMLGEGEKRTAVMEAMVRDIPVHRFGQSEEVAMLAVLLASDEATYITGSEFNIDGGLLAGTSASPKQ